MTAPDRRNETDAVALKAIGARCPELDGLVGYARRFASMATDLDGHLLDAWIVIPQLSGLAPLASRSMSACCDTGECDVRLAYPCHSRTGCLVLESMTNSEKTSVLITGGNKGLGFEAARRLGEQGWTVFLGSRDENRGKAAAGKLTDGGANVVMVPVDVTSDESVAGAVRLVREHTDRLDVLINNAGAPGRAVAPADATAGEIHSVYDTNVYGPIRVTQAFLPLLQAADHPRVVMVSSAGGSFTVVTDPEQPSSKIHELAYSSSKAALNMITVRYAQALPGIKFNIATPGEVENRKFAATDMNHHTGQLTVTEGTDSVLRLAMLDADGPTGTFIDRLGPVGW